jgi:hypothetical protein
VIALSETPDALFFSSNEYGIPDLDINMQADYFDYPLTWGSVARTKQFVGKTISFYTDDYRYTKLWERPDYVWRSGAPSFIQPNFSTSDAQPLWVAANVIGKKFWLSRYWQSKGMRCFVDLNVSPKWEYLNLAGVPLGYRAYASRVHKNDTLDTLTHQADLAESHAGTDDILFVIIGNRKEIEALCQRQGWIYVSEQKEIWSKRVSNKARKERSLQSDIHIEPIKPKRIGTLEDWIHA